MIDHRNLSEKSFFAGDDISIFLPIAEFLTLGIPFLIKNQNLEKGTNKSNELETRF
jgi:hypothetical protein